MATTIRHDSECDSPNTTSRKDSVFEPPLSTPTANEKSLTPSNDNRATKRDLKRELSSYYRERDDFREHIVDEELKAKKKKLLKMKGI